MDAKSSEMIKENRTLLETRITGKHFAFAAIIGAICWVAWSIYGHAMAVRKAADELFHSEQIVSADQAGDVDAVCWALMRAQCLYSSFVILKTNVVYAPRKETYRMITGDEAAERQAFGVAYEAWARNAKQKTVEEPMFHCDLTLTNAVLRPRETKLLRLETKDNYSMEYALVGEAKSRFSKYKLVSSGVYETEQLVSPPLTKYIPGTDKRVWNNGEGISKQKIFVHWIEVQPK